MLEVWESTTLKGPWILDEQTKATADQIENDRLFVESLQDSEYTQLSEYLEYDENDEDNFNPEEQEEQTNEKNEILFDGHLEASRVQPKTSRMCDISMDRPSLRSHVLLAVCASFHREIGNPHELRYTNVFSLVQAVRDFRPFKTPAILDCIILEFRANLDSSL